MSDRMTSVHLPGMRRGAGLADWGRKTPADMIFMIRSYAKLQAMEAAQILAAHDDDFRVVTYLGHYVQKKQETLQEGRAKP